jgi:GT2 family glycosyltransferase
VTNLKHRSGLPRVSITILNWNGLEHTIDCLESLRKITYPNYEVIVVDNASSGNDVAVLKKAFAGYVHIIRNDRNYGFAEGCNTGMRYALSTSNPDYLLLLNNDVVVAPDFLDELVKVAEGDPGIGIVGPKIYYYDFRGRDDIIWSAGGKIEWWRRWAFRNIGTDDEDLPEYQQAASVDWVSGAALMLKSSIIGELSLLDPGYFSGNEDVEYCLKAWKHGFKTVYVPHARIWHKVGMARRGMEVSKKKQEARLWSLYPYYRFLRRNFSTPVYLYHLLLLPSILFRWGISYLMKHRDKETLVEFLKGLVPGQASHP